MNESEVYNYVALLALVAVALAITALVQISNLRYKIRQKEQNEKK